MVADAMATQKSSQDINNHGIEYTVRCRYNTVNFRQDAYKIHPKARPLGQVMGCFLWIHILICILLHCSDVYNIVLYLAVL